MNRLCTLALCLCLVACATEPRLVSRDEALEHEARRNDALAEVAERSNSPDAARIHRDKAAVSRAEKEQQPSFSDSLARLGVDLMVAIFGSALERNSGK